MDLPLSTGFTPPQTVDSPAGSDYRETENQLLQLQVEPRTSTPEIQPHWRKPWTCHEILGINGSEWFLVKRCWGAFKNPAKDSSCKDNKTYTLCYMLPIPPFTRNNLLIQGSLWKGTMLIKSKFLGFYLIQQACFTI